MGIINLVTLWNGNTLSLKQTFRYIYFVIVTQTLEIPKTQSTFKSYSECLKVGLLFNITFAMER